MQLTIRKLQSGATKLEIGNKTAEICIGLLLPIMPVITSACSECFGGKWFFGTFNELCRFFFKHIV
ncbi:hypothetical protein D3C71_1760850 [compost metagenome]